MLVPLCCLSPLSLSLIHSRQSKYASSAAKNDLLHDRFQVNYNDEDAAWRKGSIMVWQEMKEKDDEEQQEEEATSAPAAGAAASSAPATSSSASAEQSAASSASAAAAAGPSKLRRWVPITAACVHA